MPGQTNECAFETYVEEILLTRGGWKSGGMVTVERAQKCGSPSSPPPLPARLM